MPNSASILSRRPLVALAAVTLALLVGPGFPDGAAQGQTRQETLIIAPNIDDYVTNDPHRQYE